MTTKPAADRFPGIEVDGRNVRNVIDAFRLVPRIALEAFARHGIGRVLPDGTHVTALGRAAGRSTATTRTLATSIAESRSGWGIGSANASG